MSLFLDAPSDGVFYHFLSLLRKGLNSASPVSVVVISAVYCGLCKDLLSASFHNINSQFETVWISVRHERSLAKAKDTSSVLQRVRNRNYKLMELRLIVLMVN